mmetsp:Transcript_25962/g.43517  ORF Transcript_25962/g.43517 Transcript_25962/m.43517 type:complete len:229 (-) Transcript_25962:281-967(-)
MCSISSSVSRWMAATASSASMRMTRTFARRSSSICRAITMIAFSSSSRESCSLACSLATSSICMRTVRRSFLVVMAVFVACDVRFCSTFISACIFCSVWSASLSRASMVARSSSKARSSCRAFASSISSSLLSCARSSRSCSTRTTSIRFFSRIANSSASFSFSISPLPSSVRWARSFSFWMASLSCRSSSSIRDISSGMSTALSSVTVKASSPPSSYSHRYLSLDWS